MPTQKPEKRPAAKAAPAETAPDPLAGAFARAIEPVPTTAGYRIALAVVAVVMVALPIVYLGIIGAVAWATWFHATQDVGILTARGGNAKAKLVLYAGPIAIGVAVIVLLLKPLFASRPAEAPPHRLDERKEPRLFAFVRRLCDCVGAPRPGEIVLDCSANASASFARGAGSGLRLTIGLPLVAELELRELAGVIAHEFGHFSQGAGMRLSYLIRSVNAWFARVVFERAPSTSGSPRTPTASSARSCASASGSRARCSTCSCSWATP